MIARDLVVRAGGRALLDGASVELRAGEVLGVVGPNGAGKSTLLRVLAGDLRPDAGEVTLDGTSLGGWAPRALARRRAVVAQHDEAPVASTARELVLLGRFPHPGRGDAPEDHAAAHAALALAGAAAFAGRVVETLSGGERQRVRLARALAQIGAPAPVGAAPTWLLLDEPLAGLDLAQEHAMAARIREVARGGVGVALVVHDVNVAAAVCDRVVVLRAGRIVAHGAPDEALDVAVIERAFDVHVARLATPWGGSHLAVVPPGPPRGADPG